MTGKMLYEARIFLVAFFFTKKGNMQRSGGILTDESALSTANMCSLCELDKASFRWPEEIEVKCS